MIKKTKWSKNW